MIEKQDPDVLRSASHRNMITHLTGPFTAGALDTAIPISATGLVDITWATREPLLLVAPLVSLETNSLRLDAALVAEGTPLLSILFAPYTEAGAFLPLYRPEVDSTTHMTTPFKIALNLKKIDTSGNEVPVNSADIATSLEIRLIEGTMGRLIYLLGAEKQRLRRQARELVAMRRLSSAHTDALDRFGADLGVQRFSDLITYDMQKKEVITTVRKDGTGKIIPEPDDEYRRRLKIYYPMTMNTKRHVTELLNGPGQDGDNNQGLLGELGLTKRFQLLETDDEFAITIHLVSSIDEANRTAFLNFIRTAYMFWPQDNVPSNQLHAQRPLPTTTRTQTDALRSRLRQAFNIDDSVSMAPMLATTLDRVGRCRQALGVMTQWLILRSQDSNGGSRYELGLGADLAPLTAEELNQLHNQLLNPNRQAAQNDEIEALLRTMTPHTAADDPDGAWLLQACGLRTVHRVDNTRIYVSHLPTFGLVITGATPGNTTQPGVPLSLEARYQAPEDPGGNVVLVAGMQAAAAEWVGSGEPAWITLTDQDAHTQWDQVKGRAAQDPALGIFQAAGLSAIAAADTLIPGLKNLPPEMIVTIRLADIQAQQIIAGKTEMVGPLRTLVSLLRNHSLSSILPLITTTNQVLLVIGVIGLPGAGINLSERRSTGFRWYVVPIQGEGGNVKAVGSRTQFIPHGPGLSAIVAVGYARHGRTSPYEFHVDLPSGAMLNLLQYEFLMNALQQSFPIGIEVNTFSLRQQHVDLDGDGNADPLLPAISKTFRQFRRRRNLGEFGVPVQEN